MTKSQLGGRMMWFIVVVILLNDKPLHVLQYDSPMPTATLCEKAGAFLKAMSNEKILETYCVQRKESS